MGGPGGRLACPKDVILRGGGGASLVDAEAKAIEYDLFDVRSGQSVGLDDV